MNPKSCIYEGQVRHRRFQPVEPPGQGGGEGGHPLQVVVVDPTGDVALIKLLGRDDFPHAKLADSDQVLKEIRRHEGIRYPVLVPNDKGLERALEAGAGEGIRECGFNAMLSTRLEKNTRILSVVEKRKW